MAKPVFVVSVLIAKPVFVVSVGLKGFQKNIKFTNIFCQYENKIYSIDAWNIFLLKFLDTIGTVWDH